MSGPKEPAAGHGAAAPGPEAKQDAAAPPVAAAGPDLQKQLEAKTKEAAELLDQLKRLAAEYSNYQKRMQRYLEEQKTQAVRDLVIDLLPAIDNFDRAMAAAGSGQLSVLTVLEGMTVAHSQLMAALARHGVTTVEASGQAFDPEHHEAVACLPSDTHCEGKVIEQVQRGYRLHGRTIRPARVAVSGGPGKPEDAAANEDAPEPQA